MVTPTIATRPTPTDTRATGSAASATSSPTMRRLVGEQIIVIAAQALSGLGNFAFLLVALHWLPAGSFAPIATFLALYLLVQLPANGLSAGSSMLAGARTRSVGVGVAVGVACGVALVAASPWIAPVLHLQQRLLVLLALAMPLAPPLALARGRLFGQSRPLAVAATLVAEPVVRLSIGLLLLSSYGVTGGAIGVVAAGYVALVVAWLAARRFDSHTAGSPVSRARLPWLVVAGYLGFAVVQNQDLVFANGLLTSSTAGMFAAVSTIGGIAAFATANIPLVLLPRAGGDPRRGRQATVVALVLAAVIGAALTGIVAFAPRAWGIDVVGQKYVDIASIATPYIAAMALLGVARVIGAHLLAVGRGRAVALIVAGAVAVQATAICLAPRTVHGVALSTVLAIALMTFGLGGVATLPARARAVDLTTTPAETRPTRQWRDRISWRTTALVGSLTAAGLVVRLIITRGLWLDEATSVQQARMSFGAMLNNLRNTDVHPPGYFTMLWGWVRIFGDGPVSVRMPTILLGALLVPVLYFVGRDLYGRRTGIVAALFGVVAPQMVWYSQEARMYALFMLLVTLSVWAQSRALRSGSTRAWLAHGVLCAAMLWTQYFTILVILTQQVATLLVFLSRRRKNEPVRADLLRWLGAMGLFVVLVAPLVPFAVHQYDVNQAAGRGFGSAASNARQVSQPGTGLSAYVVLANMLWAVWGYHSNTAMTALGALWPAGMLLALGMLGRGRSRTTQLMLAVALVPVALMFAIGEEKRFLFDLRYFIGCVPLLVLVAARAVTTWARSRVAMTILASVAVMSLTAGLIDQQINGSNPRRYDFQSALSTIHSVSGPSDAVVLAPAFLHPLVTYYQPELNTVEERPNTSTTVSATSTDRHVFVLGSFFDVGGERQRINALLASYRKGGRAVVQRWSFANVKVWELS